MLQPKDPITNAETVHLNEQNKMDGCGVHCAVQCVYVWWVGLCVMVVTWGSLPTSIDKINSRTSSLCSLTLPVVRLVEGEEDVPLLYHSHSVSHFFSFNLLHLC